MAQQLRFLLTSVAHVLKPALRSAAHGQNIVFADEDRHFADVEVVVGRFNHLKNYEKRFAVLFDLGPLMAILCIFDGQLMEAKLFSHGFELGRLRIRERNPNKAVGLVDEEMNLIDRNIGKLAAILIDYTIDEHVMPFANFR
jgi:hypothetical protein